jgi:hypothetical protein
LMRLFGSGCVFAMGLTGFLIAKHQHTPLPSQVLMTQITLASPDAVAVPISSTEWLADIGTVVPGKTLKILFKLTSPNGRTLNVRGVNASCGCTSLPSPPQIIASAGETNTDAIIRVPNGSGSFETRIIVTTDAVKLPPLTLRIKGQVP